VQPETFRSAGEWVVQSALLDLLDRIAPGVILIGASGHAEWMNQAAEQIMNARQDLAIASGRLRFTDRRDDAALQRSINSAMVLPGTDSCVALCTASSGVSLHVFVIAFSRESVRVIAVVLMDPNAVTSGRETLFAQLFDFTPAEARLAASIVAGMTVKETAVSSGREISTLRWHLKQIFAKTRTSRQTELVRLLTTVSFILCDVAPPPPSGGGER
jgi:DNA-binding CsgD family transcriptional regulator